MYWEENEGACTRVGNVKGWNLNIPKLFKTSVERRRVLDDAPRTESQASEYSADVATSIRHGVTRVPPRDTLWQLQPSCRSRYRWCSRVVGRHSIIECPAFWRSMSSWPITIIRIRIYLFPSINIYDEKTFLHEKRQRSHNLPVFDGY